MPCPSVRLAPLLLALAPASCAMAGEWRASATLASEYVTRGFAQSWGRPALQGDVVYAAASGLRIGAWASTLSDRAIEGGRAEVDLFVAYERELGDVGLGLAAYHYVYPGARMRGPDVRYDYGEIIPSIAWKGLVLSYAWTWTRDFNGYNSRSLGEDGDRHSRGSSYIDATLTLPLDAATRLSVHAGRQRVRGFEAYGWTDARVAVERDVGGHWTAGAAISRGWAGPGVYDAYTTGVPDREGVVHVSDPLAPAWVVSLTRRF